jgi:hypothetical protein
MKSGVGQEQRVSTGIPDRTYLTIRNRVGTLQVGIKPDGESNVQTRNEAYPQSIPGRTYFSLTRSSSIKTHSFLAFSELP